MILKRITEKQVVGIWNGLK